MTKHIWIALIAGFATSVTLLCLTRWNFMLLPHYAGFWVLVHLRGFESATAMDWWTIMVPTNGLIYAILIFLLLRAFQRAGSK